MRTSTHSIVQTPSPCIAFLLASWWWLIFWPLWGSRHWHFRGDRRKKNHVEGGGGGERVSCSVRAARRNRSRNEQKWATVHALVTEKRRGVCGRRRVTFLNLKHKELVSFQSSLWLSSVCLLFTYIQMFIFFRHTRVRTLPAGLTDSAVTVSDVSDTKRRSKRKGEQNKHTQNRGKKQRHDNHNRYNGSPKKSSEATHEVTQITLGLSHRTSFFEYNSNIKKKYDIRTNVRQL